MNFSERVVRNLRDIAAVARGNAAERIALRRRYQFDALRPLVSFAGVQTEDGLMFFSTQDRTVGRQIYIEGGWERDVLPRALGIAGLNPKGLRMVEVGANIGTTTVGAARLGAQVTAFEPVVKNFQLLRANVAGNLLDEQVTCINAGCSAETGSLRMTLSDVNHGDHRISADGDVDVPVVRLDDMVQSAEFLWIDTQGHEASVFAGAKRLLATRPVVLVELWPGVLGDSLPEFAAALAHYPTVIDMSDGLPTTVAEAVRKHARGITDLLIF